MDQAQLAAVIQRAEEIGAQSPDFMGLSLGQIYKVWPEEIYSGRVVARGRRSDAHKAAKAYTKFVQAFRELEATLPPSSALPPLAYLCPSRARGGRRGTQPQEFWRACRCRPQSRRSLQIIQLQHV